MSKEDWSEEVFNKLRIDFGVAVHEGHAVYIVESFMKHM